MSEEVTIKIKKENIWKYTTLILAAILVIGAFVVFTGRNQTTNTGQQAAQQNAGQQAAATVIDQSKFADKTKYPSLGPDSAKTTVIEFADFQCPYCALASGFPNWTAQYQSQYGDLVNSAGKLEQMAEKGQIKFIYVPLNFLGAESVYATEAALCANQQGKFWDMHDAIFTASDGPQESTGKYNKDKLEIIASTISGLDQSKFKSCLESDATKNDAQAVMTETSAAGVQVATPQFFVNGKQVASSWTALQAAIQ